MGEDVGLVEGEDVGPSVGSLVGGLTGAIVGLVDGSPAGFEVGLGVVKLEVMITGASKSLKHCIQLFVLGRQVSLCTTSSCVSSSLAHQVRAPKILTLGSTHCWHTPST